MKCMISLVLAALLFPGIARAQNGSVDNSPISSFDLSRYLGTWYEVARFDHSFERGMQNVSAEYVLRDDGMIAVFNSGWKDGKYKVAEGKAKQPDPTGDPAALKVSFFLFFFTLAIFQFLHIAPTLRWLFYSTSAADQPRFFVKLVRILIAGTRNIHTRTVRKFIWTGFMESFQRFQRLFQHKSGSGGSFGG